VNTVAPVLLIGFNRPEHLAGTIRALALSRPDNVLVAIDGPRLGSPSDIELCSASQRCIEAITWPCRIETRFRTQNLGIRYAVVDAVNWAIDLFGRAIVLEDDAEPGPDAIPFADAMLKRYESEAHVGHINLYNLVPERYLTQPAQPARLSRYPESYAWATWQRAWQHYDDDLSSLVSRSSLEDLYEQPSTWGRRKWLRNLRDAHSARIDTWAYRWIASLWRHRLLCISPNRNLTRYTGQQSGTHTHRRQRWSELDISALPIETTGPPTLDASADSWLARKIFRETPSGCAEGMLNSLLLTVLRTLRSN